MMEQKAVGTDVRSKEVYSAAISGLEHGVDWLSHNPESLNCDDGTGSTAMSDTELSDRGGSNDYTHQINYTVRQCRDGEPMIVTIASMAQGAAEGDSHVQKTVSVDVVLGTTDRIGAGDPLEFEGPPVMVEGCMSGVSGNPDIYPRDETDIAIGTTNGTVGCVDHGHFDLYGGTTQQLSEPQSLATAVFGSNYDHLEDDEPCPVDHSIDVDDPDKVYKCEEAAVYKRLRGYEDENPQRVMVVDGEYPRYPDDQPGWNGNNWHSSLGTEENPVILYFDRSVECPKINGGPVIHGLIYFADKDCGTHGWGNSEIYGTVALRGDMTSHTANTEIHGRSLDFGGSEDQNCDNDSCRSVIPIEVSEIPGSWRDF